MSKKKDELGFRISVQIEMLIDYALYKKGDKPEVHAKLADKLVKLGVAKQV